jgi:hypothetical protein
MLWQPTLLPRHRLVFSLPSNSKNPEKSLDPLPEHPAAQVSVLSAQHLQLPDAKKGGSGFLWVLAAPALTE